MMNFLANFGPWLWLCILIICVLVEIFTFQLTTIWAAISALPMIFIARTGLAFQWQLLIFAVLTVALLFSTRPFVIKKLKIGKFKTNVDDLIGQEVLVVKNISRFEKGEVKAKNGVIWNAMTSDDTEIEKDSVCIIERIEGNTLVVKLS